MLLVLDRVILRWGPSWALEGTSSVPDLCPLDASAAHPVLISEMSLEFAQCPLGRDHQPPEAMQQNNGKGEAMLQASPGINLRNKKPDPEQDSGQHARTCIRSLRTGKTDPR